MLKPRRRLIADANVLIDYVGADASVLSLLARHAGALHIPAQVLVNVDGLDAVDCDRLGLIVVDPTLEQLLEAARRRGGLALDDHVCLVMARDHGWCCLTNDRALRNACGREGVPVLWGLEAMLGLVETGLLPPDNAIEVGTLIHRGNPAFVASAVLAEFERKVLRLMHGLTVPRT